MQMLRESEGAATRLLVPAMGPRRRRSSSSMKTMQKLKASSGKDFDRVYVSHEIEMHQRVLETVGSLATQTQNAELTELVASARPSLEAYLKAAQRSWLNSSKRRAGTDESVISVPYHCPSLA
jgi:predicted outer membrane protein